MGLDFVRKAARAFHKGLDVRRIQLATPTLFSEQPISAPRTYAATLGSSQTLTAGEKLSIRLEGELVLAMRGLNPVATVKNPPAELVSALSASYGEACGTVQQVHSIASVAEISIC